MGKTRDKVRFASMFLLTTLASVHLSLITQLYHTGVWNMACKMVIVVVILHALFRIAVIGKEKEANRRALKFHISFAYAGIVLVTLLAALWSWVGVSTQTIFSLTKYPSGLVMLGTYLFLLICVICSQDQRVFQRRKRGGKKSRRN